MADRIVIPVDGVVDDDRHRVELATRVLEAGGTTVVTLRSPLAEVHWLAPRVPLVGIIDDWGAMRDNPIVNYKAWALYGGAPLFGTMVVASDDGKPLPHEFVEMVMAPIEEWVPAPVLARMRAIIEGMPTP